MGGGGGELHVFCDMPRGMLSFLALGAAFSKPYFVADAIAGIIINIPFLSVFEQVANIPGKTIKALMSRMPNVNRVVVLTPPGTTRPEEKKEQNIL